MGKTIEQAGEILRYFDEAGLIGSLTIHRGKTGNKDIWVEQILKMDELDEGCRDAARAFVLQMSRFASSGVMKIEIVTSYNGIPDRVKLNNQI